MHSSRDRIRVESLERRVLFTNNGFGIVNWNCIPASQAPLCDCQVGAIAGAAGAAAGAGGASGGFGAAAGGASAAAGAFAPYSAKPAGAGVGKEGPKVVLSDPNALGGQTTAKYAGLSAAPVRYFDGYADVNAVHMSSDGFGKLWGQARSYSQPNIRGPMGNHWVVTDLPFISVPDGPVDTFIVSATGVDNRWFYDMGSSA